jgi:hypothetical protein
MNDQYHNSFQTAQKAQNADNEMIRPDPSQYGGQYQGMQGMNQFGQYDSFSPNRNIMANEMKYYPNLNHVNALYSTNTAGVEANISPQQNQFSYVNHNQMPNCVRTDAHHTQTMTETSNRDSSIMHIQPVQMN